MPQKEVLVADEDQHHKDGRKQRTLFCRHDPLVPEAYDKRMGCIAILLAGPNLVSFLPGQETSIARRGPRGPTEAYILAYVAGSAPGGSNAARRS